MLKFLVGRARPAIGNDNLNVFYADPFNLNSLYQSFPSGHTQVIFCVGTMLSYLWPKRRIEFLAVALSIALTRVLAMEHFVSDVYVGMLIGTLGCNASVNFWSRWVNRPGPWKAI
jgi:membrane-associated phospholipid phosphatase